MTEAIMLTTLLSYLSLSGPVLVVSADLPVETNSTYVQDFVFAPVSNDSIAFQLHVPTARPESVVVRYDAATNKCSVIPGVFGFQQDCGLGILTVIALETSINTNFSVATGKPLSQHPVTVERVGRIAVERYSPMEDVAGNDQPRVFDVLDGRELTTVGRHWSDQGYLGQVAWDDGTLRMFGAVPNRPSRDGVELFKTKGYTFERGEAVEVTNYSLGFDRLVGNPAKGNFAAAYSSNRRIYYTTLTRELKKTPFQADVVRDICDKGVLGKMITHTPEYGDPTLGPLGCWDPMTGKKLWQLEDKEEHRAIWLDKYALVGNGLLDPASGEVLFSLPKERMFVAARGDTFWMVTNDAPRKIELWKIR
jgi:hypothetical protein